ncbi:MAG: ABC transporter C-terminal domain-containing protein, partial [Eubacteriales bacterium]|nr:ABC transporter C-terminal domain-containing protein [Eubacteriales bacterium]
KCRSSGNGAVLQDIHKSNSEYRNNRSRSLSAKAAEIERNIEALEESMKQLCAEEEKNQSDYEKLQSLMEEKGRIAGEIEALYHKWAELSVIK